MKILILHGDKSVGHISFSLGDERLNDRASYCFSKLRGRPGMSFPQLFKQPGDLQAFYRFINNDGVEMDDIKDAILSDTKARLNDRAEAIAIHDTTHVGPSSKSGNIEEFKLSKGFFAHVSLLVDSTSLKRIHGPAGLHVWNRTKKRIKKGATGEFNRWLKQVDQVEADFANVDLIHVMDREGDASSVWSEMYKEGRRFVIRGKAMDRPVHLENGEISHLIDEMKKEPVIAQREVTLSKRTVIMPRSRYNPRDKREANLNISAKSMKVQIRGPTGGRSRKTVNINVVYVFEDHKRSSKDQVEWLLLTTEPIETEKQILRVVDIYKARWIIEEFFKGLKTGCRLEERLLCDAESWHKLFTFCLPIATTLLNMRANHDEVIGGSYFSDLQMRILKLVAKDQNKKIKTNDDAKLVLAHLGGHILANGPPGWITLFRGYQELLVMERGCQLMELKRCDK